MSQIAVPPFTPARKRVSTLAIGSAVLAVALITTLVFLKLRPGSATSTAGEYHRVVPMDLEVKLVKDGELQAMNNIEIACEVEGQTTIQTIVKEGSNVKAGDILVTLDSSNIRQRIEDTTIELQKAEADVTNARELRDIQESKNAADLDAAMVALTLAQLDLRDYEEAAFPQLLANAKTDLEMSHIDLKNRREELAQRRNLFAKGFVTATDVKKSELEVTKAENAVNKAETALKRLEEYTHASELAAKKNTLSQAELKVARVKRENASQMSQRTADVNAKENNLGIIKRRMERLQEQLDACTIEAPTDGMVVYATSNDRNAQNMIQEGATLRERQAILRLPDTSTMKAVLRVQEAQVSRLREGQRALVRVVGMNEPVGATLTKISVLADSGGRWWNPDTKEFPVDLVLDKTPPNLKPGMGAMCEILIGRAKQALAVPLGSIYSVGNKTFVFTRDDTPRPVEVKLGLASDTHAQVMSGLTGGEEVLILERGQGQTLLDRAGIKVQPATRPSDSFDRPGGAPAGGPNGMPGERQRRFREGGGQGPSGGGPAGDGQRMRGGGDQPGGTERPAGAERPSGAGGERPQGERRGNRDGQGAPPTGAPTPAPTGN